MSDKLEALKAAALAIGRESWVQDGSSVNTEDYRIANGEMCCDHIGCFESVNGESPHAKYVAAASPAVVLELLAALEEKDARTAACVNAFEGIETERIAGKNLGEFLAGEVRLNKAEPKPDGSFGFTFSGFAVQLMAEAFAEQFKASGAVNYLELLFEHKDIGPLTVTMQRIEGLTPAQKLAAAQQREEHLKADVAVLAQRNKELEADVRVADGIIANHQELNAELEQRLDTEVREWTQKYVNEKSRAEQLGKSLDEANAAGQGWMERANAAEQRLQQPIKLPDIRSEDYHESGWFQHMKYYRAVVRSIQALGLKVEGE